MFVAGDEERIKGASGEGREEKWGMELERERDGQKQSKGETPVEGELRTYYSREAVRVTDCWGGI